MVEVADDLIRCGRHGLDRAIGDGCWHGVRRPSFTAPWSGPAHGRQPVERSSARRTGADVACAEFSLPAECSSWKYEATHARRRPATATMLELRTWASDRHDEFGVGNRAWPSSSPAIDVLKVRDRSFIRDIDTPSGETPTIARTIITWATP